jgi:hypothetical protein
MPQTKAYPTAHTIFKIYNFFLNKMINNKDGALIAAIWPLEPKEHLKQGFPTGRGKRGSQRARKILILRTPPPPNNKSR